MTPLFLIYNTSYLNMEQYYVIKKDGTQAGPLTVDMIIKMIDCGEITGESLVAFPGAESWGNVSELLGNTAAPNVVPHAYSQLVNTSSASWNPVNAFKSCMRHYACFSGRASRSEYWFYSLANLIIYCFAFAVDVLLFAGIPVSQLVFLVGSIVPGLAVSWRRMHDSGLSGVYTLLSFIPYVGFIIVIILACRPSSGPNQYGRAPLAPMK